MSYTIADTQSKRKYLPLANMEYGAFNSKTSTR